MVFADGLVLAEVDRVNATPIVVAFFLLETVGGNVTLYRFTSGTTSQARSDNNFAFGAEFFHLLKTTIKLKLYLGSVMSESNPHHSDPDYLLPNANAGLANLHFSHTGASQSRVKIVMLESKKSAEVPFAGQFSGPAWDRHLFHGSLRLAFGSQTDTQKSADYIEKTANRYYKHHHHSRQPTSR